MITSNRNRKRVCLPLILAMVLTTFFIIGAGSAYAAAGSATISSQTNLTAEAGSTVTVPVILSDNPGIAGMGLIITYDQEVLTPLSVTATEFGACGDSANYNDSIETSTDNSFKIIWAVGENLTGNGTMFNITFRVSDFAQGNTNIDISYSKPDTFNDEFEDVQLNCSPATVNVTPKTATVTTLKSNANQTINAGEEIEIPIIIDNVDKVSSLSFDLKFDSAVFSEASVTSGIGTCTAASSGDQLVIDATAIDTSVASGTLCTVKFKTTDYMSGNYVFDLSSSSVAVEDFQVKVVNTHADENSVVYGKNVTLAGNSLSVDVGIKNNHGIAAFRIYVNYDASKLTPVSVTKNAALSGSFDHTIGKTEGSFNVLWFSSDNFTQNNTLFTMNFTVKDGASGTTQISLDYNQEDTCDEHLNDVVLAIENIDVELTSGGQTDEEAAASVTAVINTMDPADASSVAAARAAYDALTDSQKALVDPAVLKKLTDAEEAIAQHEADQEAATEVATVINAMDPNDANSVAAARAAYDALTDAQKVLVDSAVLKKLTDAEEAIAQHEADQAAAAAVIDAINAMDPNDANSVAAARAAYNVLTDAQKALIDVEVLKKLTDAEEAIDQHEMDQAAAANAAAVINAMDPNDASSVAAARATYDALTDAQKALVDPTILQKLTEAEEAIAQHEADQQAANAAVDAINAMDPNDPSSIAAARAAYDALTDEQKALVDPAVLKKLTDAEEASSQHQADQQAADAAVATINAMDPNDASSVAAARAAYDALTDEQKALVDPAVLKKLTDAEAAISGERIDLSTLEFVPLSSVVYLGIEWDKCWNKVELKEGSPQYLYNGEDYEVTYRNNVNVGTATVILTGIGKYKGEVELSFDIKPLDMNDKGDDFKLKSPMVTYTGKVIKPRLLLNNKSVLYVKPTTADYTVKCSTDRKSVGKHTLTFVFKGNYSGSFKKIITIVPKGTKLIKLKKGKKSLKVKWKKQATKMSKARITGYQIRYSLKSNMKGAKLVKVKGFKKTSKKIKKLKSKKKYYVQIRTYMVVKGKTYYSSWSAKKTIKTK